MKPMAAVVLLWGLLLTGAGPLAGFDEAHADIEVASAQRMEDLERCFFAAETRVPSLPQVVRQPDRPDVVMMIWTFAQRPVFRIDLNRTAAGTRIKGWAVDQKQIAKCA